MHILLAVSAFNSLTQRVHAELRDHGHSVAVELALPGGSLPDAVRRHRPDLVLAPMLKTVVPREVWSAHTCLIVHPGPLGDRGPSSLDWAVTRGATRWGVTVLQAGADMDAGDVWATVDCPVPPLGKSDLYRGEIADAALTAVLLAVDRFASGNHTPQPQPPAPAAPCPTCARSSAGSTGGSTPPRASYGRCAPPTPGPASSTTCWAASGTCTAAIRRTGCAAAPENCWPPARARSAGRPATAPCGSPS